MAVGLRFTYNSTGTRGRAHTTTYVSIKLRSLLLSLQESIYTTRIVWRSLLSN